MGKSPCVFAYEYCASCVPIRYFFKTQCEHTNTSCSIQGVFLLSISYLDRADIELYHHWCPCEQRMSSITEVLCLSWACRHFTVRLLCSPCDLRSTCSCSVNGVSTRHKRVSMLLCRTGYVGFPYCAKLSLLWSAVHININSHVCQPRNMKWKTIYLHLTSCGLACSSTPQADGIPASPLCNLG